MKASHPVIPVGPVDKQYLEGDTDKDVYFVAMLSKRLPIDTQYIDVKAGK
jgi:hypothetical protein